MRSLFLLLLLFLGCGEQVKIYETSCPNLEGSSLLWLGEVHLQERAKGIAYWSCIDDECTYHDSYGVRAWIESPTKVMVCCGLEGDRVDLVKFVVID